MSDFHKKAKNSGHDNDIKIYNGKLESGEEQPGSNNHHHRNPGLSGALFYILIVIAVSALLAAFIWLASDDIFAFTDKEATEAVTISDTDSLKQVAQKLEDAGMIKYKLLFRLYGSLSDAMDKINAGTYELNTTYDYRAMIVAMGSKADSKVTVTVSVPEGYELKQIISLLAEDKVASEDELWDIVTNHDFDYSFLDGLALGEKNRLEGYLFPDTYYFYEGDDPVNVIDKFLSNFQSKFTTALSDRAAELGMSIQDTVNIASMIQKEAASNSEMSDVSSVIHNRLNSDKYPLLEIDATIQYVLAERKEVLELSDLQIDSPYNTYLNPGLPAGPIANPGLAAIKAALYPSDTEYYFYALDKDGTHHFSKTYAEHKEFLASLESEEN